MKAKRLGRGLSGLISRTDQEAEGPPERGTVSKPPADESPSGAAHQVPAVLLATDKIRPNPYQPRVDFGSDDLKDLRESIAIHGIIQPLVVRNAGGDYELIAGERRLRAAREVGLEEVPVVVRRATDEEMQTLALVENIQRVDLNAMEKAHALKSMMRNFELTQEQVAERVGKARTTIANIVRLLDLPDEVQELIASGALTGAQGRAVLQADGSARRIRLATSAVKKGWSVREIERRARLGPTIGKKRRRDAAEDPYVRDIQERLTRALSTQVHLSIHKDGAGAITVSFHSQDELDRLIDRLED